MGILSADQLWPRRYPPTRLVAILFGCFNSSHNLGSPTLLFIQLEMRPAWNGR
jgi:hypothetical protein